jgi:hypothetical protein
VPGALVLDMRRALLFLLVLAAALPASASAGPLIGIADDRVLLNGGPAADEAVAAWAADGVDVVRIFVQWDETSPSPGSKVRPAGAYDFARIDAAVDRVRAAGMEPMLTLTGPGPVWAMQDPSRGSRRYRPSPSRYAEFAQAAAEHFKDRVHRYILWNEPNLAFWLQPLSSGPAVYRNLVNAAVPAIRSADSSAKLYVGALAPRAQPLSFLRRLGCVNSRYRRIRTGACRHFHPITATSLAYHPHSVTYSPLQPFPGANDANLASLGRLESVLDRLRRAGRLRVDRNLWIDEYGYQTNPPDPFLGVSPSKQDHWLQEAAYLTWRNPRVKLLTQYVWQDEPALRGSAYSGWQSGLRYAGGRAKPALAHFPVPFFLDARRGVLWGQVRPGASHPVLVQRRRRGGSWTTVARVVTDSRGYWVRRMHLLRGASYRFVPADGATHASASRAR